LEVPQTNFKQEFSMSVRITERLIGDVVIASGLPNSPLMVVQSIDEQAKTAVTTWFSDGNVCQEGMFPGSALDRAEAPVKKVAAAGRGKKPVKKA
jgi:hypothetical protein